MARKLKKTPATLTAGAVLAPRTVVANPTATATQKPKTLIVDGQKRAIRFPKPTTALRQHVAANEAEPKPPVRIRVRPPPISVPDKPPAAVSRARALVRELQERSPARTEATHTLAPGDLVTRRPLSPIGAPIDNPEMMGSQIRALRRAQDLTQEQLATLAGVGRRFVVELESGKPGAELGRVLQVLRALSCALRMDPLYRG